MEEKQKSRIEPTVRLGGANVPVREGDARLREKASADTLGNLEDVKQLVRSRGSVGANYIEANESVSQKDFLLRIKTCRKESKESAYWLRVVDCRKRSLELEVSPHRLTTEARELMNIFAAILRKSE